MASDEPIFVTGQVVDGKYRVTRQLGQGGMGAVYEATHLGTHRRVALKVIVSAALANEPGVVARFEREARASGAIDSAHVVQVLDTGVDSGSGNPYMVMELLSGEDVSDVVRRHGPLPPDVVLRIGAQSCLGLQRAHDAGIVHRDIKSANLYLAQKDGGEIVVKVLDFGIAKVRAEPVPNGQDRHLTSTGSMIGSPLYMSPEQARSAKHLDGRSDIWSLGVVLYEALAGVTPHHDKETLGDLLIGICVEPVPPLQSRAPWVPPEIARVVERALERDPAARYATATEMHAALVALLPGGTTTLREEMLVPVSAEARTRVAPRMPMTMAMTPGHGAGSTPPPGGNSNPGPLAGSNPGAVVAAGVSAPGVQLAGAATTNGAAEKAPAARLALLVAPILVLGLVGGGVALTRAKSRSAVQETSAVGLVQASPSASTVLTQAPTPSASAAPTTTARVAAVAIVAPADARVEVDGVPAPIQAGAVDITGAPGSLHKLRITSADVIEERDVTILENGTAMPARIEVSAKKKPTTPTSAPAAAAAKPVAAKPAAATTAAKPGNEPEIKTNF